MTTTIITEINKDGTKRYQILCECGWPINRSTSSGMHCSNPDCPEKQKSDELEKMFKPFLDLFKK